MSSDDTTSSAEPAPALAMPRRHDLDALRAVAMLLGIALHAALSFVPFPWVVQDVRQHDAFGLFFHAIHGFRMPLFFLVSGFFTAMLWRRRGLRALLWHRFRRVFLPCLLGLFTIIPAMWAVIFLAIGLEANQAESVAGATSDLWTAARNGDDEAITELVAAGADINARNTDGVTPLSLATLFGRESAVEQLLAAGADVNAANQDGATPLHGAAFLGHDEIAGMLIEAGADVNARNNTGDTPLDSASADWTTTVLIAGLLQLEIDAEQVQAGRARSIELLTRHGATGRSGATQQAEGGGRFDVAGILWGVALFLMYAPLFHHLWFLWFLCWLVAGFAVYARIAERRHWTGAPRWLIVSPARYLWLVPLTILPQAFMGLMFPTFGPDTSTGPLPAPQILLYYAIFFGFGALYFDCDDRDARLGRGWRITLPVGLLLLFPLGLEFTLGGFGFRERLVDPALYRPLSVVLQVLYAWTMTFALMGMFHSLLSRESRAMRYLSDSSYWLYVAHLPLILLAQLFVRTWDLPAAVKFGLVCTVTSGLLLLTYQTLVRYTWIGTLLNGRRERPVKAAAAIVPGVEAGAD